MLVHHLVKGQQLQPVVANRHTSVQSMCGRHYLRLSRGYLPVTVIAAALGEEGHLQCWQPLQDQCPACQNTLHVKPALDRNNKATQRYSIAEPYRSYHGYYVFSDVWEPVPDHALIPDTTTLCETLYLVFKIQPL